MDKETPMDHPLADAYRTLNGLEESLDRLARSFDEGRYQRTALNKLIGGIEDLSHEAYDLITRVAPEVADALDEEAE